jgi:glycosyltransferase involved in cell wall biosynthesis
VKYFIFDELSIDFNILNIFQGRLNNALQKARALVLPSLLYETQGLVVNEAAAPGICFTIPDRCVAQGMVENGRTGLRFRGERSFWF